MILSDRDGTPEVVDEPAWVLVYILDDDGTAFQYHNAPVPDPCSNAPTPPTIVFPYDRYAVANYAIATASQNHSVNLENGRVTSRLNSTYRGHYSSTPFANFTYVGLNHSQIGATGSARYTSQPIWIGGMPMTRGSGCGGGPGIDIPWRYCDDKPDGSGRWRSHQGILGHYIDLATFPDSSGINDPNNVRDELGITLVGGSNLASNSSMGEFTVRFRTLPLVDKTVDYERIFAQGCTDSHTLCRGGIDEGRGLAVYFNIFDGVIKPSSPSSDYAKAIGEFVKNIPRFAELEAGDYVFIDSRLPEIVPDHPDGTPATDDHGFVIVGWGQVVDCEIAIETYYIVDEDQHLDIGETNKLTLQFPKSNQFPVVPYVADFSGPLNNRLQSPAPRPFYCSSYRPIGTTTGGFTRGHAWFFFHFPDKVTIQTTSINQLYTSNTWKWTMSDGVPQS